ncbi:ribonuclease PH [Klebsiella pneumoniae]|nr:ribonuclease PH [Klebsiella pneumoniae]
MIIINYYSTLIDKDYHYNFMLKSFKNRFTIRL